MKLTDGRVWHCHQDQVRRHSVDVLLDSSVDPDVSVSPTEVLLPPITPTEPLLFTPDSNVEGFNAIVAKDTVAP